MAGKPGIGFVELLLPARIRPPIRKIEIAQQGGDGNHLIQLCVALLHRMVLSGTPHLYHLFSIQWEREDYQQSSRAVMYDLSLRAR